MWGCKLLCQNNQLFTIHIQIETRKYSKEGGGQAFDAAHNTHDA